MYGVISKFNVLIGLALMLNGCSSIALNSPLNTEQSFPVPIHYCINTSATPNKIKEISETDKALFTHQLDRAISDIHTAINDNLKNIASIQLTEQSDCIDSSTHDKKEITGTPEFQLIVDLSSYDGIKTKWKYYLIGSGFGEGVVQGVVVAGATQNPLLGVGVALEECVSEYLTWNGVDWFLGETYAPVTLEATLIRLSDKVVVWQDSEFVSQNDDELDKLTEEEKKQKERQLLASLHKAELDLFSNLNEYIKSTFKMVNK